MLLHARMHLYHLVLYSITAIWAIGPMSIQFTSQKFKDTNLHYVKNSSICETTLGVTQYSGYIEAGKNMSMVSPSKVTQNLLSSPVTVRPTTHQRRHFSLLSGVILLICFFQGVYMPPHDTVIIKFSIGNGSYFINPGGKTTYLNPYR